MTWLIRLYPPAWRRRYGRELAELIATQPASFGTAIDLVAGAVDAWLNPQSSTAAMAADAKGAGTMVPKMLQLRCAGYGPNVTGGGRPQGRRGDDWRNPRAGACLDVGHGALREKSLSRIAPRVSWLVPLLFSQRYTDLKGRSGRVQAVFIGGPAAIVIAIALAAAWINTGPDRSGRLRASGIFGAPRPRSGESQGPEAFAGAGQCGCG